MLEEIHTATQIQEMILKAGFKMNPYAKAYFDAMTEAEDTAHMYGATPEKGLKVQVRYFFSNCRAMTDEQKKVKKQLMEWSK